MNVKMAELIGTNFCGKSHDPRKVYRQSEIKLLIQNTSFFYFSEIQIRKYAESIFSYITSLGTQR